MTELDEKVARAIGWGRRPDGEWLNSWGAPVNRLPPFSTDPNHAATVVRSFEEGTFTGKRESRFLELYRSDMTPEEICLLALRVTEETKGPAR